MSTSSFGKHKRDKKVVRPIENLKQAPQLNEEGDTVLSTQPKCGRSYWVIKIIVVLGNIQKQLAGVGSYLIVRNSLETQTNLLATL